MFTTLLPVYRKTKKDLPNLPERILDGCRRRPQPALPHILKRLLDVNPRRGLAGDACSNRYRGFRPCRKLYTHTLEQSEKIIPINGVGAHCGTIFGYEKKNG